MAPHGLGRLLTSRHGGVATRTWRRAVLLVLDLWLIVSLARMVLGSRADFVRDVLVLLLVVASLVLVLAVGIVRVARRRVYELHERALVLGRRGESETVVVPWASVDPGRVILSAPPRGVRARTPRGLIEWTTRPPVVLLNGRAQVPEAPASVAEPHRYATGPDDSTFDWWRLEVTDPVDLLTAIESAMLADGQPARGLAAAVLSRNYRAGAPTRWATQELERGPADAAIGLGRR